MKLGDLLKSKDYLDAKARVKGWKGRLEKGGAKEAALVRDEKSAFFVKLRDERPDIYLAFQVDDKTLSETIFKLLTGREIIID